MSAAAPQRSSAIGIHSLAVPPKSKSLPASPQHTFVVPSKRAGNLIPTTLTFAAIAALGTPSQMQPTTSSNSTTGVSSLGTTAAVTSSPSNDREQLRKSNPEMLKRASSSDDSMLYSSSSSSTITSSASPASATPTSPKSKTPELIRKRTQVRAPTAPANPLPSFTAGLAKSNRPQPSHPNDYSLDADTTKSNRSSLATSLHIAPPPNLVNSSPSVKSPRAAPAPNKLSPVQSHVTSTNLYNSGSSYVHMPFPMHDDDAISPRFDDNDSRGLNANDHNRKQTGRPPWHQPNPNRSISPPPRLTNTVNPSSTTDEQTKQTKAAGPGGASLKRRRSHNFEDAPVVDAINRTRNTIAPRAHHNQLFPPSYGGVPQYPAQFWHQPMTMGPQQYFLPASAPATATGYDTPPMPIRSHHSSPGGSTATSPSSLYNEPWSSFGHGRSPGANYDAQLANARISSLNLRVKLIIFFCLDERVLSLSIPANNVPEPVSGQPDQIRAD